MQSRKLRCALLAALLLSGAAALAAQNRPEAGTLPGQGRIISSGLLGSVGGTIGPDGALYVAEGAVGQVARIDPASGRRETFVTGLPVQVVPLGGPIDVAFHDQTPYVLVSLVGDPLLGASATDGIYRIADDGSHEIIADLGSFSAANPPPAGFDYFLVNGVQFALEAVDDGFLVSDGHLNRVLHVSLAGDISIITNFDNVAPSGLVTSMGTVYLAEVGPVPHEPAAGRVVAFSGAGTPQVVASGVSMIVDVAFGPRGQLYALSQGDWGGGMPGDPAAPDTGRLLQVNGDGTFTVLAAGIDRPSSLSIDGSLALVVTLTGDVLKYRIPPRRAGW